ncbi:proteasome accessory factor PafA2 family protein, partial [Patescibacteria group bacterium AH-259-L07]|nr:proteasome accessory factor PafA2 family protein [Patescibacteria group bacterium AH-259-L07]
MHKRIYGLENEHRVIKKAHHHQSVIDNTIADDSDTYNKFMANGAKIYIDSGCVEYATPECSSVIDLIAHERAGSTIVFEKLQGLADVLKSSRGWENGTSGCHENYFVEQKLVPVLKSPLATWYLNHPGSYQSLANHLLAFLISRQILCGAGAISPMGGRGFCYQISQRADYITTDINASTRGKRPILNCRSELDPSGQGFRLHLILGDANMSEVSTLLKVGTTGFILRMIEAG